MKGRNHTFDLLCGLCIIRMMFNHFCSACGFSEAPWWLGIMHWSYFLMCFFFFKAGYFNKTTGGDTLAFCKRKALNLMVPYFVWGAIGNAIYFFFVWFILDPRNTMSQAVCWEHLWQTSGFYGNGPCWFLFSFFVAYVAMHVMGKVRGLRWIALLFPLLSWWLYTQGNPLWLNLNNVFLGIFLFFLGRVWRWLMERLGRLSTALLSICLVEAFVWLNTIYAGSYNMMDNHFEGASGAVLVAIVCICCGASGLLMSLRLKRVPVLGFIGEHSMVFFVAHWPIIQLYKMIRSACVRTLRGNWDDFAIIAIFTFGICFLLVSYVEKVPWLSGRFAKKKVAPESAPSQGNC